MNLDKKSKNEMNKRIKIFSESMRERELIISYIKPSLLFQILEQSSQDSSLRI